VLTGVGEKSGNVAKENGYLEDKDD